MTTETMTLTECIAELKAGLGNPGANYVKLVGRTLEGLEFPEETLSQRVQFESHSYTTGRRHETKCHRSYVIRGKFPETSMVVFPVIDQLRLLFHSPECPNLSVSTEEICAYKEV